MAKKKPARRVQPKPHKFGVLHIPKNVRVRDSAVVDGGEFVDPEKEDWAGWADRGKQTRGPANDSSR